MGRKDGGHVTEPAGPLPGGTRARSELGCSGTRRRPASRGARRRCHQGRAAGWGSFSAPARVSRLESQPEVGGARPQGGRGSRGVPASESRCRCRGGDVQPRHHGAARTLLRGCLRAVPPVVYYSGAGLSARAPSLPIVQAGTPLFRPAPACRASNPVGDQDPPISTFPPRAWPRVSFWQQESSRL